VSDDLLTRRLRRDLPGPSEGARARMRSTVQRRLEGRPEPPRQRSRVIGALGVAGALAAGIAFFALALPRGEDPQPPSGAAGPKFGVLDRGTPFDLASTKLTTDKLSFPGVQAGSLRLSRTLSVGTKVVVGRASNDYVCLFLIPPRSNFRNGTCAPPRDIGAAALVQFAWWGKRQIVLLVADGVRLVGANGEAVAVRNNTAVLDRDARQVLAISADGARRTLRLAQNTPVPLVPHDARARLPVVPDLTGLTPGDAATVLAMARLADGTAETRPVADTPPNTIIGQSTQPGTTAAPRTEIGLVLAAPAGPGGQRTRIPEDLPIRWAPTPWRGRGPDGSFSDHTAGDLSGAVRVLLFPNTPAQAAQAKWLGGGQFNGGIVVTNTDEATAPLFNTTTSSAGLISDPRDSLARAVGVTRRPAIAVLDRTGAVAYLATGVLTQQGRGGPGDLDPILSALQQEPVPEGTAPDAPAGLWFLRGRNPLPVAEVPTFILRRTGSCAVRPDRVWEYGPTADGWRGWIALTNEGFNPTGPDLVLISTRGTPIGSRTTSGTGCGLGTDFATTIRNKPVLGLGGSGVGQRTTSLWVVRPGYTRATTPDGRTWPVANGLLSVTHNGPFANFTLTGPAGTRTVTGR